MNKEALLRQIVKSAPTLAKFLFTGSKVPGKHPLYSAARAERVKIIDSAKAGLGSWNKKKGLAAAVAAPAVARTAYNVGNQAQLNAPIPFNNSTERTPVAPELLERMAEVGETGQTSSAAPPSLMDAFKGLSPGKRAALGILLGGGSGLLGSKIYGGITGKKSTSRDIASAITGGTAGGALGASLSKESAEEARMDGLYSGYKRQ